MLKQVHCRLGSGCPPGAPGGEFTQISPRGQAVDPGWVAEQMVGKGVCRQHTVFYGNTVYYFFS